MFPVSTKADGMCTAFPDVCLVPPVPVPLPFTNIAQCRDAEATSTKVLACNKEVVVETSVIPSSQGDEAGKNGGIISGVTCGKTIFKSSSSRVYAEGKHVVIHLALTSQNSNNAPGIHDTPSQAKVLAGA